MTQEQLVIGGVAVMLILTTTVALILRAVRVPRTAVMAPEAEEHLRKVEEWQTEVAHWKTLYLEECRKREEQFQMISGIQRERDGWKDIFWQSSREMGVAQEYMIRVNQHLAKICGKNPDAKMPAMRKAFLEQYGEARRPEIEERIQGSPPVQPEPFSGELDGGVLTAARGVGMQSAGVGAVIETVGQPVAKPEPNA